MVERTTLAYTGVQWHAHNWNKTISLPALRESRKLSKGAWCSLVCFWKPLNLLSGLQVSVGYRCLLLTDNRRKEACITPLYRPASKNEVLSSLHSLLQTMNLSAALSAIKQNTSILPSVGGKRLPYTFSNSNTSKTLSLPAGSVLSQKSPAKRKSVL